MTGSFHVEKAHLLLTLVDSRNAFISGKIVTDERILEVTEELSRQETDSSPNENNIELLKQWIAAAKTQQAFGAGLDHVAIDDFTQMVED